MKKAIVQYHINLSHYSQSSQEVYEISKAMDYIYEYSEYSMKKYCQKYGHDFIRVTQPKVCYEHPTWERLDLWFDESWFDNYDEICYTDTDVYALPNAPDIFSFSTDIDAFKAAPYHKHTNSKKSIFEDISFERFKKGFQAGVWILTKKSRDLSLPYIQESYQQKTHKFRNDAKVLNWSVLKSDCKIFQLPAQFNVKYTGNLNSSMYFCHAFGKRKYDPACALKQQLENIFPELVKKD